MISETPVLDRQPNQPSAPDAANPAPVAVNPPDKHIWGIYIMLCLLSIVELYSASSREIATRGVFSPILGHVTELLMGFVAILVIQRMHYRWFVPLAPLVSLISAALMVYVMFKGVYINGARRALALPGFTVQPSEFLKISSALFLAWLLSKTQMSKNEARRNWGVFWAVVVVSLFGGLLFPQGLTNAILLMAISLSMMLVGGIDISKWVMVILIYIVVAGGYYGINKMMKKDGAEPDKTEMTQTTDPSKMKVDRSDLRKGRLATFFDPTPPYDRKITSENRQEMYSYIAQANGGVFGVGPGNSRETARLPLAFSDYIYAIVVEDLGLVGGLFVLVLYLWLLARAGSIARRCSHAFPALLVTGMAVVITFQALFHMAIVTGVFPVSGQPLPLFSKGGTSILVTSVAFGIMLSVSRYAVRNGKAKDIKNEAEALPEDVRAVNPGQF